MRGAMRPLASVGSGELARVFAVGLTFILACQGEAGRAREAQAVRAGIADAETTARSAAALPSTGLWTEPQLVERLMRAGVVPRAANGATADTGRAPWMARGSLVYFAGGGEVHAWIYRDSSERRAVTDRLDPATATPAGMIPPFSAPMVFLMQNNLAVVITGGSEPNQERIALALQAGLPVTARPPR